jgi:hypothetical protein
MKGNHATQVAAVSLLLWSGTVLATDVPIPGKVTVIKDGKLFKLVSKPVTPVPFPVPAAGGPADPLTNPSSVSVIDTGGVGSLSDPLVGGVWSGLGNPAGSRGYKYSNAGAPGGGPVKVIILKGTVIKIVAKDDGTLDGPLAGAVGVRLSTGADRYCATLEGTLVKNVVGSVKRKDAPTPAACAEPPPIVVPSDAHAYPISSDAQAWLALVIGNSLPQFAEVTGNPLAYASDYAAITSFRLGSAMVTVVLDVDGSKQVVYYTFGAYAASGTALFLGEVTFIEGRTPRPDNPDSYVGPGEEPDKTLYDRFDASPVDQNDITEAGYAVAALRVFDKMGHQLFDSRTSSVPMWGGGGLYPGTPDPNVGTLAAEAHVAMWVAQAAVHDHYAHPTTTAALAVTRPRPLARLTYPIRPRPLGGGVAAGQGDYRFEACRGWGEGSIALPAYTRPQPRQNTFPWVQPAGPSDPEGRCGQTSAANYFTYWNQDVSPKSVILDWPWSCADWTPGTRPNTLYKCMNAIAKENGIGPAPGTPVTFDWNHPASSIRNDDAQLRNWVKTLANGAPRPIVISESRTWRDYHWMNLVGYGDFNDDFWVVLMDGNYEQQIDGLKNGICFHFYKWDTFKAMWGYNVWGYPSYVYISNTPAPAYLHLTVP